MKILPILPLLLVIFFLSCNKTPRTIDGEVFIVTQGAGNIKLGLVRVEAFLEKDVKAHISGIKDDLSHQLAEAKTVYEKCVRINENGAIKQSLYIGAKAGESKCGQSFVTSSHDVSRMLTQVIAVPVASSTTNADGKFQISVPADQKLFLIARGQRQLIDSTEEYYWLKVLPPAISDKEQPVFLSNDSILDPIKIETFLAAY